MVLVRIKKQNGLLLKVKHCFSKLGKDSKLTFFARKVS